jgi:hypothetical protein
MDKAGLLSLHDFDVQQSSLVAADNAEFAIARQNGTPYLAILAPAGATIFNNFEGTTSEQADKTLLLGPTNARNLEALRGIFAWLRPRTLGLQTSAGFGDRLGLATPGHIRALRKVGGNIAPIFAQQSIREMTRTARTAQQVLDDATWGVFGEGWQNGFGADADHLKTTADIDACLAAGFTFYTIDPGEHVDNNAETADAAKLNELCEHLPWQQLEDSAAALSERYKDQTFEIEGHKVAFDDHVLKKAAVKYGRAVAHVTAMYRHLVQAAGNRAWELEISVDETDLPTTHAEHIYVVSELRRLGVQWVSLAPRYVGSFEKGIDYKGDLLAFEADIAVHAAIMRQFGPYKLSLHSGSDKFSIYPAAVRQTRGLVHLKTAGTSWLEALRVVAATDPALFRDIYTLARDRYETDRASYHVSGTLTDAPVPAAVADADLPGLLEQLSVRQILHVTFGSVVKDQGLSSRLMALLRQHPEDYASVIAKHFERHLAPFAK